MEKMNETISVSVEMLREMEMEIRVLAAKSRISRAEFVRRAVVEYLEKIKATTDELHQDN